MSQIFLIYLNYSESRETTINKPILIWKLDLDAVCRGGHEAGQVEWR